MRILPLAVTLALTLGAGKGTAHEFWIEPTEFMLPSGAKLEARLRIGENMDGVSTSYLPRSFTRFDIYQGVEETPVDGRMGDNPALQLDGLGDGLAVIVHETSANRLKYEEWAKFQRFADHKDFPDIEARHMARGLPREGFRESYIRYAKSLVAIGDGAGSDLVTGLRTEIVAEANPYIDDISGGLPVQVLFDGSPRMDAQVELFDRAPDGEVSVTLHRTDDRGIALLPVAPGHAYLADAVVLEAVDPEEPGAAVWHTLWASLTFAVPSQ